jgi:hypothetical protein
MIGRSLSHFRTWWRLKWYGADYAPPCRLPDYKSPRWTVRSNESGQVELLIPLTDSFDYDPTEAYMLGSHLRDHALALGGLVHLPPEDVTRREALRRAARERVAA